MVGIEEMERMSTIATLPDGHETISMILQSTPLWGSQAPVVTNHLPTTGEARISIKGQRSRVLMIDTKSPRVGKAGHNYREEIK